MRRLLPLLLAVTSGLASPATATPISKSTITVFGTLFDPTYPPEATIDDDLGMFSFWHGQNDIQIGDTNYLAYRFDGYYALSAIFLHENYQNRYLLGELDLQWSLDSTGGLDGTWTTFEHIAGDFNPPGGDFVKVVQVAQTRWLRLFMTYEGRATHGSSPAFYLTEIDIHGEPVAAPPPSPVPEPGGLLLLGSGLAVLALRPDSPLRSRGVGSRGRGRPDHLLPPARPE